jgi:hypothetical protein
MLGYTVLLLAPCLACFGPFCRIGRALAREPRSGLDVCACDC